MRRERRLVLAAQDRRHLTDETPQHHALSVHEIPAWLQFIAPGAIGFRIHDSSLPRRPARLSIALIFAMPGDHPGWIFRARQTQPLRWSRRAWMRFFARHQD